MNTIKKIVLLMMENRSLDNVCGWAYEGRHPQHFFPATNTAPFDGLVENQFFCPIRYLGHVRWFPVRKLKDAGDYRVPSFDPNEAYAGVLNQVFGTQNKVTVEPEPGTPPTMKGFLQDYSAWYMTWHEALEILATYTRHQLPVINSLAYQYAISDRWFSSVPTETNPNRAFSICATSLGRVDNGPLAIDHFDAKTLFNVLSDHDKTWGLYYHSDWLVFDECFTEFSFPRIEDAKKPGRTEIATIDRFYSLAASGDLPQFTYIEPKWGFGKGPVYVQGNDYHPPTVVTPGEELLWKVYTSLRQNDAQWQETLLIVTFDEHGGTYDHVPPPWGAQDPEPNLTPTGFAFDRFGVRVPTLLISPQIQKHTVFRSDKETPFDHTSVMKTVFKLLDIDPDGVDMGQRMAAAPLFDEVLDPTAANPGLDLDAGRSALEGVERSRLGRVADRIRSLLDALDPALADLAETEPPEDRSAAFEGIPFAVTRAILSTSETTTDVELQLEDYRSNAEGFVRGKF